ncbi:MAG: RNA polymerase sigma-70 factor [Agriterribacter sp.]
MTALHQYNDEQLAKMLTGQDGSAAFEILYDRYWEKLLIHSVHLLGSEPEAEEVVQNVFMKIWRSRDKIEIRNTFHTYISSCVKYEIITMLALQKRQKEADSYQLSGAVDDHCNNTLEQLDYESTRKQLEATILQLPEKCQLVFRLSREEGLSEKQISGQLAISGKTVQAHMTKALKTLRSNLQQCFFSLL